MVNLRNRRQFLATSLGAGSALLPGGISLAGKKLPPKPVRLGLIADLHHQFVDGGQRRLNAFLEEMGKLRPDAIVQLGDFTFPNKGGQALADAFNGASEHSLHVIGNHDLDLGLTREHCLDAWGIPAPFYRHDVGGLRLLILDGNDKGSPNHKGGYPSFVGDEQAEWLSAELASADLPIVVFSHQPLAGPAAVDNAPAVRKLLSAHREKVLICLNGHTHLDTVAEVEGIHYLHINSASYYWVGGKHRTLFYRDALFGSLNISPHDKRATLVGKTSDWDGLTPDEIGLFKSQKYLERREFISPKITDRSLTL